MELADKTITDLTSGGDAQGSDLAGVDRGSISVNLTVDAIKAFALLAYEQAFEIPAAGTIPAPNRRNVSFSSLGDFIVGAARGMEVHSSLNMSLGAAQTFHDPLDLYYSPVSMTNDDGGTLSFFTSGANIKFDAAKVNFTGAITQYSSNGTDYFKSAVDATTGNTSITATKNIAISAPSMQLSGDTTIYNLSSGLIKDDVGGANAINIAYPNRSFYDLSNKISGDFVARKLLAEDGSKPIVSWSSAGASIGASLTLQASALTNPAKFIPGSDGSVSLQINGQPTTAGWSPDGTYNMNSAVNGWGWSSRVNSAGYFEFYGGNTITPPRWNIGTINANSVMSLDADKAMVTTQLTDGQILIGSTGAAPVTQKIYQEVTLNLLFNSGATDITMACIFRMGAGVVTLTIPSSPVSTTNGAVPISTAGSASPAPLNVAGRTQLLPFVTQQFPIFVQIGGITQATPGAVEITAGGDINIYSAANINAFTGPTGNVGPTPGTVTYASNRIS
jgi:hypothetical protein